MNIEDEAMPNPDDQVYTKVFGKLDWEASNNLMRQVSSEIFNQVEYSMPPMTWLHNQVWNQLEDDNEQQV